MNIREEPARKLFLGQFLNIAPHYSGKIQNWIFPINNNVCSLRLVWIQGVITNVNKIADSLNTTFKIDDGTGTAVVLASKETPGYGTWISLGKYVMAIGELISNGPTIEIKAVKLTKLSGINAEAFWILEVLDFWKYLQSR